MKEPFRENVMNKNTEALIRILFNIVQQEINELPTSERASSSLHNDIGFLRAIWTVGGYSDVQKAKLNVLRNRYMNLVSRLWEHRESILKQK